MIGVALAVRFPHQDNPYSGLPADAIPPELKARGPAMCWACGEELTDEFEAGQRELLATLNKTALAAYLRKHRDTHRQYLLLQPKLQLCEYSQRHTSLSSTTFSTRSPPPSAPPVLLLQRRR